MDSLYDETFTVSKAQSTQIVVVPSVDDFEDEFVGDIATLRNPRILWILHLVALSVVLRGHNQILPSPETVISEAHTDYYG